MTAELIVGIGPETLALLNRVVSEAMRGSNHTPVDCFAALILKGINEDMASELPDGVGTVVHITNRISTGFLP